MWKTNGEGWAKTVDEHRTAFADRLAALESGRLSASIPVTYRVQLRLISSVKVVVVLAAANALAIAFGRLADLLSKRLAISMKSRPKST